jgi:hypothetical protein
MRRVFLLAVLLLGSLAFCQDCTTSIVVNVFDDRLHVDVRTLKANDFNASMDGASLAVINSQQEYNSRLLVLLETDDSASNAKISDIVDTVTRMTRQAPEGKPVAFGVYADKAVFTKDFTADPEKRTAEINEVIEQANSLGKRVALYDALHQALQLFGEHQPGDTILLIGSPYDDKSNHSIGEVKKEFLATGTRLMAMVRERISHVGRDFMLNSHEPEKSLFLDFAEQTGGAHSEFDPHFFGFAWRGYLLDVKVPDRFRKPHGWSLKVRGLSDGYFKHTKVFYPELLPPCRVAAASGN